MSVAFPQRRYRSQSGVSAIATQKKTTKGRYRRISLVIPNPGERLLTEPSAGPQPSGGNWSSCPIPAIDRRHPDRLKGWKCVIPGFVWRVMTGAPNRSLAA
jgi:hypothetical protein